MLKRRVKRKKVTALLTSEVFRCPGCGMPLSGTPEGHLPNCNVRRCAEINLKNAGWLNPEEAQELTKRADTWGYELGKAARMINCAGPVSHRIYILKQEYQVRQEKLMNALKDAIGELKEHNSEYQHRTPESKIKEWKKLTGETK